MLICLPAEVWKEILGWLRPHRGEVALKFSQLGDRQFSAIYQHWLHQWIKNVELGWLTICSARQGIPISPTLTNWSVGYVKAIMRCNNNWEKIVPFAKVEVPANIRDFPGITINYFDTAALQFLHRLKPLLVNVHLDIDCYNSESKVAAIVLDHLLPLLNGIETIVCNTRIFEYFYPPMKQLCGVKLIQLNGNDWTFTDEVTGLICRWLCLKRRDGQPRICQGIIPPLKMLHAIRKHFLRASSRPVSFLVRACLDSISIQESTAKNAITGEQLVVRKVGEIFLIGRCSSQVDGDTWLREMCDKADNFMGQRKRKIRLAHPTLGPIDKRRLTWM